MFTKRGLEEAARMAEEEAKSEYEYRLALPVNNEFNQEHERSLGAENALRALAARFRGIARDRWI